jgi:hypothetical protein
MSVPTGGSIVVVHLHRGAQLKTLAQFSKDASMAGRLSPRLESKSCAPAPPGFVALAEDAFKGREQDVAQRVIELPPLPLGCHFQPYREAVGVRSTSLALSRGLATNAANASTANTISIQRYWL